MNRDGLGSGMAIVPPPKTGAQQSAQNTKRTLIGPVNKIHTVWDIQRLYNISSRKRNRVVLEAQKNATRSSA